MWPTVIHSELPKVTAGDGRSLVLSLGFLAPLLTAALASCPPLVVRTHLFEQENGCEVINKHLVMLALAGLPPELCRSRY